MNPLIDTRLSKTPRLILIAALVIGVYTIDDQFGWSLYGLARANLEAGWPHTVAVTFLRYGLWTVLIPLLVAAIVVGPHRSAKALGLDGSPWVAAKIGLIATAILPIAYALTAPILVSVRGLGICAGSVARCDPVWRRPSVSGKYSGRVAGCVWYHRYRRNLVQLAVHRMGQQHLDARFVPFINEYVLGNFRCG